MEYASAISSSVDLCGRGRHACRASRDGSPCCCEEVPVSLQPYEHADGGHGSPSSKPHRLSARFLLGVFAIVMKAGVVTLDDIEYNSERILGHR